jgi:single-strand DNA-binding protein
MTGEIRFPIVGNLTTDPELRYTQNGLAVVNFTIASTPRESDGQGGQKDGEAIFMRCSAWREFAEHIAASLSKGNRVIAYGRYKQRRYQTEDQQNRTSHEFEVEAIGADLRWATATVTKATSAGHAQQEPAEFRPAFAPSEPEPWADETPF